MFHQQLCAASVARLTKANKANKAYYPPVEDSKTGVLPFVRVNPFDD